jgi:hypothetical protein
MKRKNQRFTTEDENGPGSLYGFNAGEEGL